MEITITENQLFGGAFVGTLVISTRTIIIWWGFSSCTETMKVMERFIGRSGVRTIFMIDCINGKAIKSHSFYKDENEILLMPGTYLRVVDKWSPADDLYMIRLQEDIPPYPLVASPFTPSSSTSSVNALPVHALTISSSSQPKHQAASAQSHRKSFFLSLSYFSSVLQVRLLVYKI